MILHCLKCSAPWDAEGLVPGESFECACGEKLLVPGAEEPLPDSLPCPRCGSKQALEPYHPEWALVLGCPRCEGLLVSIGAIQKLVGNELVRGQFMKELPEARWASRRRVASRLDDAAPCPACGLTMTRHTFAGSKVVIDSCHTHGSWFDPDELRQALETCAKGAAFADEMNREALTWGTFSQEQAALDAARDRHDGAGNFNILVSLLRWF